MTNERIGHQAATKRRPLKRIRLAAVGACWVMLSVVLATTPVAAAFDEPTGCPAAPAGMNVIVSNDAVIVGTPGPDFICAGDGDNDINGMAGDDIVYAGGGDDFVRGRSGDDELYGGDGRDNIRGSFGDDVIDAGPGNDRARGGPGDDQISAGAGRDRVDGGRGDDVINGGDSRDILKGRQGNDVINGDSGRDRIVGGNGADTLRGGLGADLVNGGFGDDEVWGDDGDDRVEGGDGADTLAGGPGLDVALGGGGADECSSAEMYVDCETTGEDFVDSDGDLIGDALDNCVNVANAEQADVDGDGAGDSCDPTDDRDVDLDGVTVGAGDCNDDDASVNPAATDTPYDGVDQDCDGEDQVDVDADNHDAVPFGGDCNDQDAGVSPNQTDVAYDGIDQDCDGSDLTDVDDDGFDAIEAGGTDCDDNASATYPGADEITYDGVDQDCDGEDDADLDDDGFIGDAADGGDDCNDLDATINPDRFDAPYDGIDQDCDGEDVTDVDGDGVSSDAFVGGVGDCNDVLPSVYPGATEVPYDGIDQDCDGADVVDNDGDGSPSNSFEGGTPDCNDRDSAIHPGATEIVADGIDQNCDGYDWVTWHGDADGDGFGDPDTTTANGTQPDGYVTDNSDCDDTDADTYPGALEVAYDGVDQDCDGLDLSDVDGDGHDSISAGGDDCNDDDANVNPFSPDVPNDGIDQDCDGEDNFDGDGDGHDSIASGGSDCDDNDASTHPGGDDYPYDGIDQDCDGADLTDVDGDGFDADDFFGSTPDCNDTEASINPDATETPGDGIDQDCDGADAELLYLDWLNASVDLGNDVEGTLSPVGGLAPYSFSFDDTQAPAWFALDAETGELSGTPDAPGYWEIEVTVTDDLGAESSAYVAVDVVDPSPFMPNTWVNENALEGNLTTWTIASDVDGGVPDYSVLVDVGTLPDGFALVDGNPAQLTGTPTAGGYHEFELKITDAEGREATQFWQLQINPTTETHCDDGIDNDFDAFIDYEDSDCYQDDDNDGYAAVETAGNDCNDDDAAINPGATDTPYDGVDQDCDGADNVDADGDGWTAESAVGGTPDCNDDDAAINPDATDYPYDGVDQNCDGADVTDVDGDGFDSTAVPGGTDCADGDAATNPAAYDYPYDGKDQDCTDGDETDVDGDGFTSNRFVGGTPDCNDVLANIHPGATEIPADGVDQDCDGADASNWFEDVDEDGYGKDDVVVVASTQPVGHVAQAGDCNDDDAAINPAAAEILDDGTDQNCDPLDDHSDTDGDGFPDAIDPDDDNDGTLDADDAFPLDGTEDTDTDEDGTGDNTDLDIDGDTFEGPNGDAADCDDFDPTSFPGAVDVPIDGIDQDCDGEDASENPFLVNRHTDGTPAAASSSSSSAASSADGRYIVYVSSAANLVADDINFANDIFLTDTQTGTTTRISVATDGTQANSSSSAPAISADGRYVTYQSNATNLVDNDTNGRADIFLTDTQTNSTTIVSVASDGTQVNSNSYAPAISADGRYITYRSDATNLVDNDTNGRTDIFVTDTQTGTTTLISVATDGTQANNNSTNPVISADGRYITYSSSATNLVTGDTNSRDDIFLTDTQTGTTTRISIASDGVQGNSYSGSPAISADGRYITYRSDATNLVDNDTNGRTDVFLTDTQTGTTTLISVATDGTQANNNSANPVISADGRYITYHSYATNLVTGDTNSSNDIFLTDTETGETTRVSEVAWNGDEADSSSDSPVLSADGSTVAFHSQADNLVDGANDYQNIFVFRTGTVGTELTWFADGDDDGFGVNNDTTTGHYPPSGYVSAAGDCDDTNADIYPSAPAAADGIAQNCGDTDGDGTPDTADLDADNDGHEGPVGDNTDCNDLDPAINPAAEDIPDDGIDQDCDGEDATENPVLVSLHTDGTQGNNTSDQAATSADGRYVVFESDATNLVDNDTNGQSDIFLTDTQTGETTLISVNTDGTQGNIGSSQPAISADGRYITYSSKATNLVTGDTNNRYDIFLTDTQTNTTTLVSAHTDGTQGNDLSLAPAISADGRYITYHSDSTNLVTGDTNGAYDIFLTDTQTSTTTRISVAADGTQTNSSSSAPAISADGRYITYSSNANNLVAGDTNSRTDIFLTDTQTNSTTIVSVATDGTQGNSYSSSPAISADGRYVTYSSDASNLVTGDTNSRTDIFLTDTQTNTTTRISIATDGTQTNNASQYPAISADGRYITYHSDATNLVTGDTNGAYDIFLTDTQTSTTTRISIDNDEIQGNGHSYYPAISADASTIVYESDANNLPYSPDTNSRRDIFTYDTGNTGTELTWYADTDEDGYGDTTDTVDGHYPPSGYIGDGSGDVFPNDPTENADTDGDGTGDNADDLPNDPTETIDTDDDGTGNNADLDDDGDGTPDVDDAFPLDAAEDTDSDGDGIGDNADPDADGDGFDLSATLDNLLVELDSDPESITDVIPNIFLFSDGVTGTFILDGGNDMYDGGNYLNTDLGTSIAYSDGVVASSPALGATGSYFTRKYDGLFVFVGDFDGATEFSITGNLGADGSGSTESGSFTLTSGGTAYTAYFKRVFNAGDPSVNHLIIVPGADTLTQSASTDTNDDFHQVSGLADSQRLVHLLFASSNGGVVTDGQFQEIAEAFLAAALASGADCDDTDAAINPDALDAAGDGIDQNCDGVDGSDVDGDGFAAGADCNDTDPTINPDATDIPDDGIDQDCDGEDATENPVLVSLHTDGTQGNNTSDRAATSADGRYVVFESDAANLVDNDTNGYTDIFLTDTQTGTTTLVSAASDGTIGNSSSDQAAISADGSHITYRSHASNLASGDSNGSTDIFVTSVQTGITTLVSVATDGSHGNSDSDNPSISADGRYVTFQSASNNLVDDDSNGAPDIFLTDTQTGTTTRINTATDGTQTSNGYHSFNPAISADGRFITYESDAPNLVDDDTNEAPDIFLTDTRTGETTRINTATDGTQTTNHYSNKPAISANGRYVVFESEATNLTAADTNLAADIFLTDTQTGTTTRVSVATDGTQTNGRSVNPAISADGRFITYDSIANNLTSGDTNGRSDTFLTDVQTSETTLISIGNTGEQANGHSYFPAISADASTIVYESDATNLPYSADTNSRRDIFGHDTGNTGTELTWYADGDDDGYGDTTDTVDGHYPPTGYISTPGDCNDLDPTINPAAEDILDDGIDQDCSGTDATENPILVSLHTDGTQGNNTSDLAATSADGRYVVFESDASNLVAGDTNGQTDIFLTDTQTGTTTRVNAHTDGTQANNNSANPAISADGRHITYESIASNLVHNDTNGRFDIFLTDTQTGTTTRVNAHTDGTQANDHSFDPAISADGRNITYRSRADTLIAGDSNLYYDIFLTDTQTGTTTRVNAHTDGTQANNNSYDPAISADGRYITYESTARNLVDSDTNSRMDIFLTDTQTGTTTRISVATDGTQGNGDSRGPAISADGRYISYYSFGSNLVHNDTNGRFDIFLADTQTGTTTRVNAHTDGTQANNFSNSYVPSISADGRYITYYSDASNLITGDTNSSNDIFLTDTQTGTTTLISIATDGTQGSGNSYVPSISADASTIVFQSAATNLVDNDTNGQSDVFSYDTGNTGTELTWYADGDGDGFGDTTDTADGHYPPTGYIGDGSGDAFPNDPTENADTDGDGTGDNADAFPNDPNEDTDTDGDGTGDNADPDVDGDTFEGPNGDGADCDDTDATINPDATDIPDDGIDQDCDGEDATENPILVSLHTDGTQGNGSSERPATSADGRYVVFESDASNLVDNDTNGYSDIFLTDTQTGTITRISVATDGSQSNSVSAAPAISADGRYITYYSDATNLVSGDTNSASDIFLTDTQTGTTTRISVATDGTQSNNVSFFPAISADGRYISYYSSANNLVTGDTNNRRDIFLTDTQTGTTTRISVATDGTQSNHDSYFPAISADGRYITYRSEATNLVTGDTNATTDIFLTDTQTGTTTRISVATDGTQSNGFSGQPAISADGRYITYYSNATNLVTGDTNSNFDIFLSDTQTGTTTRISVATDGTQSNHDSYLPAISADGRYITYASLATNLVTGDTNSNRDIFLTDTQTGTTTRISVATDGTQANDNSQNPAISADASTIIYESAATNLVDNDTNGTTDIFSSDI